MDSVIGQLESNTYILDAYPRDHMYFVRLYEWDKLFKKFYQDLQRSLYTGNNDDYILQIDLPIESFGY